MEKIELTTREKEVGAYLAAGLTAKQVARKLNISFHTVEGYQRTLKRKLQSKTLYQTGFLLSKLLVAYSDESEKSGDCGVKQIFKT